MVFTLYMKRNKQPKTIQSTYVLSNGSTLNCHNLFTYKEYTDQTVDIFNNNKWNSLSQSNLEDSFRGQQLKFKKRYRLKLSD